MHRNLVWSLVLFSVVYCPEGQSQKYPSLSTSTVKFAIKSPLTKYGRSIKGGAHTNRANDGGAPVVLSLASFLGNESADRRLFQQIRYTLNPGNEITANGGYPAQHERHITGMFAIVRLTARIWDSLSASEQTKIDLIMKASAVASAFTTSDHNPFISLGEKQYALDGDGNLSRNWNPNYREGMIGGLLPALVYFGGPDALGEILDHYRHDAFVTALSEAKLKNLLETFTWKVAHPASRAPTGEQIEQGVRNYRLHGIPLKDYRAIYKFLAMDTFSLRVNCGLKEGAGINGGGKILSGCDTLPNKGRLGMLKEFSSVDARGTRSSFKYSYHGFRAHQVNLIVLLVGGYLSRSDLFDSDVGKRILVGATDLWYKFDNGYLDYSSGKIRGEYGPSSAKVMGTPLVRGLWDSFTYQYLSELER